MKAIWFLVSFSLPFLLSCTGRAEYNLATEEEEHLLFSTESEIKLGRSLARQVESKFKICKDAQIQKRVGEIGKKLVDACDRKDISYSFTALEDEKVNAFALPGGYIYINTGALEKADSDDEIAGVLAHEIGHITARHSMKRLQASLGYNLISILAIAAAKDARYKRGADLAFDQIMLGYSREDEFMADRLAIKYLKKSQYDAQAVVSFLEKLRQIEKEAPLKPLVARYYRSHPYLPERISSAKQELYGKMDFTDYINK
ncbi:MAG: M48 family metalloprotease [Candidatus Omnitrophica bacterium]|nr:M48 family metalloprotease [Candidatus Omnitrophota bacterium]